MMTWIPFFILAMASFLVGKALLDRDGKAMRAATAPTPRNFVWQVSGAASVVIGVSIGLSRQLAEPDPITLVLLLAMIALAVFFVASLVQTLSRARSR